MKVNEIGLLTNKEQGDNETDAADREIIHLHTDTPTHLHTLLTR